MSLDIGLVLNMKNLLNTIYYAIIKCTNFTEVTLHSEHTDSVDITLLF
jgi:hypothetical protein